MAGFSTAFEEDIIDHIFGSVDHTPDVTHYVALYTAAPSDAGGGTEATGGSYARVAVTNNTTNWPNSTSGAKSNGAAITFPTASASWGVVTHFGIHRHITNDDLVIWGALTASKTIDSGDTPSFAIGELDITLD
jgi:hypothetical protein